MKKPAPKDSESSTQLDSPHSPLRFQSSPLSDNGDPHGSEFHSPANSPENQHRENSKAIVIVEGPAPHPPAPPQLPDSDRPSTPENAPPVVVINRAVREEIPPQASNTGAARGGGRREGDGRGRGRGRTPPPPPNLRGRRKELTRKAALGLRLGEVVLCLISFSVMAADKTQGWSGDSFDRYTEYRYCLSMNVIGFVYSGFQASILAYRLVSGKQLFGHHLRPHFDFFMDQVLAYLLISASSSAATRVDDWQSNWGKDQFTEMASASVALSFLAFIAFAISALISGYNLYSIYP